MKHLIIIFIFLSSLSSWAWTDESATCADALSIVTRFAPSPTGELHIGGARTALFNWLYAKSKHGKFLLRIEDTDGERSQQKYVDSIMSSLKWLGIEWDADPTIQSERIQRHIELAEQLVKEGKAYYCYLTKEDLEVMRRGIKGMIGVRWLALSEQLV